MTPLQLLLQYLRWCIVIPLMMDVSNSVMFYAVLEHLHGPELITPLSHLPDHDSIPP